MWRNINIAKSGVESLDRTGQRTDSVRKACGTVNSVAEKETLARPGSKIHEFLLFVRIEMNLSCLDK
jgi:hypothetical protein